MENSGFWRGQGRM